MSRKSRKFFIEYGNGEYYPLKKWIRENHKLINNYEFNEPDITHRIQSKLENLGWKSFFDEINNYVILSLKAEMPNGLKINPLKISSRKESSKIQISNSMINKKSLEYQVSSDDNRMLEVFKKLKENFEERFKRISILELGEDSLRYDFFSALMEKHKLKSYQIQLEYPINKEAFESKIHKNSKRKENPKMDLYSPESFNPLIVEFGLFKRNSKPNGAVNQTEKLFKIFNDFIRLVLVKQFIKNGIAYFVCFADKKFLNYELKGKNNSLSIIFPDSTYEFDHEQISKWLENYKSAESSFDKRFIEKIKSKKLIIKSELVFNELIYSDIDDNLLESRILIYKITS